jgi:formate-dependent nitrite reductase membrane component NrfD
MDNAAIVIEIVALALVLASISSLPGALMAGALAAPFWAFILIGIVVPLALQLRVSFGGAHPPGAVMALSSVLVLAGGLLMRYTVLMVAQ